MTKPGADSSVADLGGPVRDAEVLVVIGLVVLDAALGEVEPDVGVQVVGGHHLQQQLERDVRPLGVKEGKADVVEDLGLR